MSFHKTKIVCPQCDKQAKKRVKPNLWYCRNCHVFLYKQKDAQKILVSKKSFLDPKVTVSQRYLFEAFINRHVQVECKGNIIVEGILLGVDASKKGCWGNMIVETFHSSIKTETIIKGDQIKNVKIGKEI